MTDFALNHQQLNDLIGSAAWFCRLGSYEATRGQVSVQSLEPWVDEEGRCDSHHRRIAEAMEWLPAQAQEADPIHGQRLADDEQALHFYKQATAALRSLPPNPTLRAGHHDFQHVAAGSAAYAFRRASLEISHGEPGFWCQLAVLYAAGQWPCGLMPDRTLVVF